MVKPSKRVIVKDLHLFEFDDLIKLSNSIYGGNVNPIDVELTIQCGSVAYQRVLYLISDEVIKQLAGVKYYVNIIPVTNNIEKDTALALAEIKFTEVFIPNLGKISLYQDYAYDTVYQAIPDINFERLSEFSTIGLVSTK